MALLALKEENVVRVLGQGASAFRAGPASPASRGGGLLIDLRPIDQYLERHFRGSVPLLYEAGPGLGGRARDLLPLEARLVLLEDGTSPLEDAAASLRGKGFDVAGYLQGGIDATGIGELISTPIASRNYPGSVRIFLNVADPGTIAGDDALFLPVDRLWQKHEDLDRNAHIGVLAGWGVRAAAAVGILENLGFENLTFVRTRPAGDVPPHADATVFRAGGPP